MSFLPETKMHDYCDHALPRNYDCQGCKFDALRTFATDLQERIAMLEVRIRHLKEGLQQYDDEFAKNILIQEKHLAEATEARAEQKT